MLSIIGIYNNLYHNIKQYLYGVLDFIWYYCNVFSINSSVVPLFTPVYASHDLSKKLHNYVGRQTRYIIVWRVDRQRTVMTCYDSFFPVLFLETNIQYSLDVAWCIRRAIDLTRINYYHLKTLTFKYSMLNWLRLIQEY